MPVQTNDVKTSENKIPREMAICLPTETMISRPIKINQKDKDGNIIDSWCGDILSCTPNEDGTFTILVVEKI